MKLKALILFTIFTSVASAVSLEEVIQAECSQAQICTIRKQSGKHQSYIHLSSDADKGLSYVGMMALRPYEEKTFESLIAAAMPTLTEMQFKLLNCSYSYADSKVLEKCYFVKQSK